jgi:hypothetical protein
MTSEAILSGPAGPAGEDAEDPLALEQQVCFALAVTSRGVIGVNGPSSNASRSPIPSTWRRWRCGSTRRFGSPTRPRCSS